MTINAAQLSKDMTQRVVPIRLDRPTYRPKWDRVVERFVKRYQLDILADIGAIFGKPASPLPVRTRWGEWERQVLGRLNPDLAAKCQDAIDVARKGLDADDEAQRDLLDAFRKSIVGCGIDPDTERVFFERKDGAEIVRIALDDRTMPAPKCYAKIRTVMAGSGVREYVDDGRRGFLWVGKKATVNAKVRAGWVHRPTPPGG